MKRLPPAFYRQDCLSLAQALLGKYLVREQNGERLVCRITETEGYLGVTDRACHTYGDRRTARTEVMYWEGGYAYVYLIYGMYCCLNVVAQEKGEPCAVLLRGGEPAEGRQTMARLRYQKPWEELTAGQKRHLADGPGKLCRALNVTRAQNGVFLPEGILTIEEKEGEALPAFRTGPRVNVDYAGEDAQKPWRFVLIKENEA